MQLGCTVKTAGEAEQASALPLDYLELKGDALADSRAFSALKASPPDLRLSSAAMTSPLPRQYGCRVVGEDADPVRALSVFRDMIDKARSLGVEVVVLGSGQARTYPLNFSHTRAVRQFRQFALNAQLLCAERDMLLSVEPLCSRETNLINSCVDARDLIDETPLTVTVDCFHVFTEGLSIRDEIAAVSNLVGHAHTSSLPRGTLELRPSVQENFVRSLRAHGYDSRLTIEESFDDLARQAPAVVSFFRRLIDGAAPNSDMATTV